MTQRRVDGGSRFEGDGRWHDAYVEPVAMYVHPSAAIAWCKRCSMPIDQDPAGGRGSTGMRFVCDECKAATIARRLAKAKRAA